MKKLAFISLVAVGSLFMVSCDDLLSDLGFDINSDYYETEFVIPAVDSGEYMIVEEFVTDELKEILEEKGYDPESIINYVKVKSVVFEVAEDSPVEDFSSIDVMEAYLYTDALKDTRIAADTNNGAAVTSISFGVVNTDVADYLYEEKVFCIGRALINSPLEDELKIKAKIQFKINIELLEVLSDEGTSE